LVIIIIISGMVGGVNVEIREAVYRERVTNNFSGYNWMVDSIRINNKIILSS